ncbi:galanin-like G-protein coupled receptor npr-9 [Babylonia areolata]|uniref:galanin-like G-protein coupled receptor npr-9 n=1 Tax=Babylonia areolata TaxID=304850 RepID=UPI003FD2DE02
MGDFSPEMTTLLVSSTRNGLTTAATSESIPEKHWTSFTIYVISQYLWICGLPLIILLGIFGNVMTIVIMRRIKSDDSTIDMYFTAIALMDIVVLCVSTLDKWTLHQFGVGLYTGHDVVCKIRTWLYTGTGTISCWYLVCMTVHRALSVVWPHRVNSLCTRRTVLLVLTGITVFFAVVYSHYMFGVERAYFTSMSSYWCRLRRDDDNYTYFFENIFVYIELLVYCLLPFAFLVVSNSILVWKLFMSVKVAGKHLTQGDSDQVQGHRKAANSVTLTVITVSLALVVLTLPTSVDFIVNFFARQHDRVTGYERATAAFVQAVTTLLSETNHAVNFYLYCLTGKRFREEFVKVLCGGRNAQQRDSRH